MENENIVKPKTILIHTAIERGGGEVGVSERNAGTYLIWQKYYYYCYFDLSFDAHFVGMLIQKAK